MMSEKTMVPKLMIAAVGRSTYVFLEGKCISEGVEDGGGTEGVNFPFNVLEDGTRIEGYVTSESLKTDAPVFTEGSIDSV